MGELVLFDVIPFCCVEEYFFCSLLLYPIIFSSIFQQAQLYYAGKSRYIGVFDSKEKASLAYEIAREVLKTDKGEDGPANAEETDRNVTLARKAAFAGVNEHSAN